MAIKVGINGFGRIGRLVLREIMTRKDDINVVGINDLTDAKTLAHLLKYDSVHGRFNGTITVDGSDLIVNGDRIRVTAEKDPAKLPWGELGCEVAIEATGVFRKREQCMLHIQAGAKKVILTVPSKDKVDATIVIGVNDHTLTGDEQVVSNASCTTNCLVPMVKILDDAFGLEQGMMTTIHSYTNDQRILDLPHEDLRRARAAALSIIPTSSGADKAVSEVLPYMKGKVQGMAMRVPTPDGSVTDFTVILKRDVTAEEVNAAFRTAAEGPMKGIVEYTEDEIVSMDIIDNPHSCIFDSQTTIAAGRFVKVLGWYDNEWGYSNRVVDLIELLMGQKPKAMGNGQESGAAKGQNATVTGKGADVLSV